MNLRRRSEHAIALFLIVALAATACGKKSPTPTEALKLFYDAAKKRDAAGIKRALSKRMLGELEEMATKENKPFDEFLVSVNLPDPMPEVRNEKVEGDTATLEIKGRGDNWRPIKFVREDGEWKIDSD